jgi:hypothetical protein
MEFQRRNGLNPDGRVNSETREKLSKAQTDAVAPWWSKRAGSTSGGIAGNGSGGGGGGGLPVAPPKTPPRQWWEPSREALPQQTGKKVWWDI